MPEGHTLHRLALDHRALLAGRVVEACSPQGRFDEGAALLDGRRVLGVEAHGKHLFYDFEDGLVLHVHLGLFGRFRKTARPAPTPRTSVRLRLMVPGACLELTGPTACTLVSDVERETLCARLGPDLLGDDANPADAWARITKSRRAIGALLLDQSVVSGVGNVYRAEGLFVVGLHPETPGNALRKADFTRLWETLRAMLQKGVRDRRIVTAAHPEKSASRVRRGERTWVYGQTRCRRCESAVERWTVAARTMYACPACQPRDAKPKPARRAE